MLRSACFGRGMNGRVPALFAAGVDVDVLLLLAFAVLGFACALLLFID